ncbi:MAG: excinuclease ABC subunit C [Acidobacteria bacterium RIFCSPLOWO2_02_FULL_61_28]|nr:MAG: excinuclease ABC subunit C [Acidobacteria bacterium RIFCSPLOWO2_02_FULL_61_28]
MLSSDQLAALPSAPGVYQFKDAAGRVIYVGKAKSLRDRVRSYFLESRVADAKTDTLVREAVAVSTILVDNEREAMALENNLIKQLQPRFNVLLRDDKTYPYVKLTVQERYPRVYVTRRLKKDGALYFGPYFPGNLAHRIAHFIHRYFRVPSCTVDLTRPHARPCLEYYIHRCQGPCVPGLTTDERYARAARDVKLFLESRHGDLLQELRRRMMEASGEERFEEAASLRDLITTVEELDEKQKMAAAAGDDLDIFGYHQEGPLVSANLFHMRGGRVLDRREFFWEDQREFEPSEFFSSLLKQLYLDQQYIPAAIHIPVEFEDCALLEELLSEKRGRRVEILTPQRGPKRAFLELAEKNAALSFEQRFRIMKPSFRAILESLQESLGLPEAPQRIECFDISHLQGSDTVASMVVWENGNMKKSDYRKFLIRTVEGVDDFAAIGEVVGRRYRRLQEESKPLPGLILIDGGIGQLHAAAAALESLGIINQPLASIAKKEEILYVYGQEDEPIRLDPHSPVLHLIQRVRDESHRFAIQFHRRRRESQRLRSEVLQIPGVGEKTARRLLERFGSLEGIRAATEEELAQVVSRRLAALLRIHLAP